MTLLTMTAAIVAAVRTYQQISEGNEELGKIILDEPQLSNPQVGNPISHKQLIILHDFLKPYKIVYEAGAHLSPLDRLLHGSRIYNAPKAKEAVNTAEYEYLMAFLRRKEEAQRYQHMLQTNPEKYAATEQGPGLSGKFLGSNIKMDSYYLDEEDEMTFADLSRQVALIVNVLVSVIASAIAIWVVSRWWDTPIRLILSITGSMLVAVAEVVAYGGYLRRISEAKSKEQKLIEKKEVLDAWILQVSDVKGNKTDAAVNKNSALKKRR